MRKTSVTFVNLSDIYDHLGLTEDEIDYIADVALRNVSYGDATYTLIPNNFVLERMVDAYEDYHPSPLINKSMTRDDFMRKFWEVVDSKDFINVEF